MGCNSSKEGQAALNDRKHRRQVRRKRNHRKKKTEDESQVVTSSTWLDTSSVRTSRNSSDRPVDTFNLPAIITVKEANPGGGGENNPE